MFTNSPKLDGKTFSNVFQESLQVIQRMETAGKTYQTEVRVSISYPGSKIPEWFCNQSSGSSIYIELPPLNCSGHKFLGLALCAVVAFKGYCYTGHFSFGIPYECCFQTDRDDRITFKGQLTVRADRKYKDSIVIDSDHVLLGYDDYSRVKLDMDRFTTCTVKFKAPENSSPRIPLKNFSKVEDIFRVPDRSQNCRLKCCGVCPIYAEPEIVQTSISDKESNSDDQDSLPDLVIIPEKKPTLSISDKIVPFCRSLHDKIGLWLSYFWIFFACLLCGFCIFVMLVFLVLQLSIRCEIYVSSHMPVKRI